MARGLAAILMTLIVVCCMLTAAQAAEVLEVEKPAVTKTKIHVVFRSSGIDHAGNWDASQIKEKVVTNEDMLNELKKRCEEIEFVRDFQEEVDGILVFGPPTDELIKIGLPMIVVYPMWGIWMESFNLQAYKGKKILFACLPRVRDASESVSSSRYEDLAEKIKLIQAVSKMRDVRILEITDRRVLGSFCGSLIGSRDREKYEKVFLDNLEETFGTEIVTTPQEELFYKIQEIEEKEAKKIARIWIDGADGIRDTTEAEIVKSAKVYLAMNELKEKYDCTAITTEGYGVFQNYEKGPIPSQGLASTQFSTDGIIATSEILIDALLTQQLGLYITGRPSFNGDYIIDPFNNIAIILHCECPLNIYGDKRRCSYVIRNLPRWEKYKGGACVQVNLPSNETVTVTKISMYHKKISIFTGKTLSGRKFFEEWDNPGLACRTKLAIKADTKSLLKNLDWALFGQHRVVFYGDIREKLKDLASLIGFDVVEEDK